ncbi:ABC-type nitrate/sulfonate/bicarbonate transport system, permease component [Opitutaceae bacterium TAV1]|nr:ABC-type nitrate/sulfonate/bicarbonate transport system, permease component [Opitutaceae bacterium TAV1]
MSTATEATAPSSPVAVSSALPAASLGRTVSSPAPDTAPAVAGGTPFAERFGRNLPRIRRLAIQSLLPLALLIVWDLLTRLGLVERIFLPTPASVGEAFLKLLLKDNLLGDFRISSITVLKGFSVGAIIGLATGMATGLSRTVEDLLGPLLNGIRQVPTLAWLPLIILWMGAGDLGKNVLIAKAVFFPVFLNTLQGIRGTPREYIEVGRIFAYGRLRLLRRIVLPAALPAIFVGLRFGAGISWAVLIVAEMLGARRGLGFLIMRAQELLHSDQLFVLIVLIGVVGFTIDVVLRRIEARLLRWKRGFEG